MAVTFQTFSVNLVANSLLVSISDCSVFAADQNIGVN
jgi:hypothetical protein